MTQLTQPAADTPIQLPVLPFSDVNLLIEGLGELPTKRAFNLLSQLLKAVQDNLTPAPPAASADVSLPDHQPV